MKKNEIYNQHYYRRYRNSWRDSTWLSTYKNREFSSFFVFFRIAQKIGDTKPKKRGHEKAAQNPKSLALQRFSGFCWLPLSNCIPQFPETHFHLVRHPHSPGFSLGLWPLHRQRIL